MNLFVYGTLRVPQIWAAVSASPQTSAVPAILPGYRIRRVAGGDFPVIGADASAIEPVPGNLMLDVSDEAMARLDAYEDFFYIRTSVKVETPEGPREAEAYVVPPNRTELFSDDPWTLNWFEETALARFWERNFGGPLDKPSRKFS